MPDVLQPIPADSPDALKLQPVAGASIPADSAEAANLVPESSVPAVPADTGAGLVSQDDYLKMLPRDEIVREYRKELLAGRNPDKNQYYNAYEARAKEGNLFGDKDLRPGQPSPSLWSRVKDTAQALDEGFITQANEATRFLAGKDFVGGISPDKLPALDAHRERASSLSNLIHGTGLAGLQTVNTLRQFGVNVANYLFRHNNAIASAQGIDNEAPDARASQLFREQFDTDEKVQSTEDKLRAGGLAPNQNAPTDPETIQAVSQSPLADPSFVLPFATSAHAGGATNAFRAIEANAAKEGPGLAARTIAKPVELAANAVKKTAEIADSSPLVRAGIAGGATAALGGNTPMAIAAALLGSSTPKLNLVKGVLEGAEAGLRNTAGKIRGDVPLGPMGKFAARTFQQVGDEGKAFLLSQAPNLPFLMGSENRDQAENFAIVGALAHGAGKGAGMAASGLNVNANFFAPHEGVGEPRLPTSELGISPNLDAAHTQTMSNVNDAGSNFVEGWRKYLKKTGVGELYVVTPEQFSSALEELAASVGKTVDQILPEGVSPDRAAQQQGLQLDLPTPEGKTRRVALINMREGAPGIATGHEIGHMIFSALSDEQKTNLQKSIYRDYGSDGIEQFRLKYAQDLGVHPDTVSTADAVNELIAETTSAVLNSVPVSQFGPEGSKTWGSTVRKIYGVVGEALSAIGASVPEAAQARAIESANGDISHVWEGSKGSGPKTALGAQPSVPGARLIENYLQAMALDKDVFKTEQAPDVQTAPAEAVRPAIEDSRVIPDEPRFKKDDVLGDVKSSDGTTIGTNAKVAKILGDRDGVHYYEIHYTDPVDGKRKSGTVPENFLYSEGTPRGETAQAPKQTGTVYPKNPVTSETPPGVATPAQTAEDIVAPKHIENVVRPEATPPKPLPAPEPAAPALKNVHVTPEQQAAFAAKAIPEVVQANTAIAQASDKLPTHEKPAYETNYYSAVGETGEDASVRAVRRKLADAAEKEGGKNPLRAVYQKIFVPYRYVPGKTPRVFGFSYDKLIQNVDILKGWAVANKHPEIAAKLSDSQFANTVRQYLQNQANGFGGDGRPVTLPSDTRPGTIAPRNPNYTPTKLAPADAQLINLLIGVELPQKSSPASQFAARMARQNGLTPTMNNAGVEITNPLYSDLVEDGFNPKVLNSVVENLPIDRMTTPLKPRPDIKFPAGDLGITRAGFLPGGRSPREVAYDRASDEYDSAVSAMYAARKGTPAEQAAAKKAADEAYDRKNQAESALERSYEAQERRRAQFLPSNAETRLQAAQDRYDEVIGRMATAKKGPELEALRIEANRALRLKQKAEDIVAEADFMPDAAAPKGRTQGNEETRQIASRYIKAAGIEQEPHTGYAPVNVDLAKRLADFYTEAADTPEAPEVQAAYQALADETLAQYQAMVDAGIQIEPYTGKGEPYKSSKEMMQDVRDNKHLYFLKTEGNFEGDQSNALLRPSGIEINGQPLLVNDVFRAVHDFFGHTAEGYEFGPRGEYNAYLAHSRMFSPEAKPALAAETLAQNSYVNYGAHLRKKDGSIPAAGEEGFVPLKDRPFAPQKNLVVPQELLNEADVSSGASASFLPAAPVQHKGKPLTDSLGDVTLNLVHFGNQGLKEIDPKNFGKSGLTPRSELSGAPRSYFYEQGKTNKFDPVVKRGEVYGAKVSGSKIYDGDSDSLNYESIINREKADQMLKDAGYVGIARTGDKYRQVELFKPTAVRSLESPRAKFLPEATPAQEKAFKDSAVRDADGNLLPLFHGTYSEFKKFKKGDLGYHFGTKDAANARIGKALSDLNPSEVSAENAFDAFPEMRENLPPGARGAIEGIAEGSRTLPVFLNIKNPLRMPDVGPWDDPSEVWAALPNEVHLSKETVKELREYDKKAESKTRFDVPLRAPTEKERNSALKAIREDLKKDGYDGIVYENNFEAGQFGGKTFNQKTRQWEAAPAGNDSYIAFDNNQIMPAFSRDAKARFLPGATYSWIKPNGEVIPIDPISTHSETAREYFPEAGVPITEAWDRGWLRVTNMGNDLYAHNESGKVPTAKQRAELENIAIENGKGRITLDTGNDSHVIWADPDVGFLPETKLAVPGKGLQDSVPKRSLKNVDPDEDRKKK